MRRLTDFELSKKVTKIKNICFALVILKNEKSEETFLDLPNTGVYVSRQLKKRKGGGG